MTTDSILVTGGAGFIGSHLVDQLVAAGYDVTVLDKLTYAGNKDNLSNVLDDITFIQGDICDRELVNDLYEDTDAVINMAAESHVDNSIDAGEPFVESNVRGAFVLMDELRNHDLTTFLHMSTDEVYGSIESGQFEEDDKLDPSSPYSASKAAADMFVNAFQRTYGLPITVARCTNAYGPRQHDEKLIPTLIRNAVNDEELPIYGDGQNTREWLYVKDIADALITILEQGEPTVYNIGGGTEKTNLQMAKEILNRLDKPEELITFVEDRPGHDQRYALDYTNLRENLGWTPSMSFDEGLERTVDHYRRRYV